MFELKETLYAISKLNPTDTNPNANAKMLVVKLDKDNSIAKHAPTLAPDETPKISGETN